MCKKLSFDKDYGISKCGNVYSYISNEILKQNIDKHGYLRITIRKKSYQIHRLVLMVCCNTENMEELQVNHVDGNRQDNDLYNLEWVTSKENIVHAIFHGNKSGVGSNNNNSKLKEEDVLYIRNNHKPRCAKTRKELCEKFNIGKSMYYCIVNNTHWTHI